METTEAAAPGALLKQLFRLPGSPQLHRWADWAELQCLASGAGALSIDAFTETSLRRREDHAIEIHDDAEDPKEPDPYEIQQQASDHPAEGDRAAETNDRYSERARYVYRILTSRVAAFGNCYPFDVVSSDELQIRPLTDTRRVYATLLLASSFRYLEKKAHQTRLAAHFEVLSALAMKEWLPEPNIVRIFGSGPTEFPERYVGSLRDKFDNLISDLGEDRRFKDSDYEDNDSGDGGLDLVAWRLVGDQLRGRPLYFGQCACTPLWVSKQHTSCADSLDNVMSFMVNPINTCWIPFDFRDADGNWCKAPSIHKTLVLDRRRVLHLLRVSDESPDPEQSAASLLPTWLRELIDALVGADESSEV